MGVAESRVSSSRVLKGSALQGGATLAWMGLGLHPYDAPADNVLTSQRDTVRVPLTSPDFQCTFIHFLVFPTPHLLGPPLPAPPFPLPGHGVRRLRRQRQPHRLRPGHHRHHVRRDGRRLRHPAARGHAVLLHAGQRQRAGRAEGAARAVTILCPYMYQKGWRTAHTQEARLSWCNTSPHSCTPRVRVMHQTTQHPLARHPSRSPPPPQVTEAVAMVKELRPDILVEGPIQYDAAIDPEVRQSVGAAGVGRTCKRTVPSSNPHRAASLRHSCTACLHSP